MVTIRSKKFIFKNLLLCINMVTTIAPVPINSPKLNSLGLTAEGTVRLRLTEGWRDNPA